MKPGLVGMRPTNVPGGEFSFTSNKKISFDESEDENEDDEDEDRKDDDEDDEGNEDAEDDEYKVDDRRPTGDREDKAPFTNEATSITNINCIACKPFNVWIRLPNLIFL